MGFNSRVNMTNEKTKKLKKELGESIIESHIQLNLLMRVYDVLCDILDELKKPK